jgi:hypothetical protein
MINQSRSPARIEVEVACAERYDLKHAASDGDVLHKVHYLVLVGEVVTEAKSCSDREHCEHQGHRPGVIAEHQHQAAADFDNKRQHKGYEWQRQTGRGDKLPGPGAKILPAPLCRKIAASIRRPIADKYMNDEFEWLWTSIPEMAMIHSFLRAAAGY